MASDDEGEDLGAISTADMSMSPISAADLLNRSRRISRPNQSNVPNVTSSTPAKRLFPDNIDSIAPGMTPTSKNQKKSRTTPTSNVFPQTPRRSPRKSRGNGNVEQPRPPPSSTSSQRSDARGTPRGGRDTQTFETPRASIAAIDRRRVSQAPPSSVVATGKRKARDSDDTSVSRRVNQFGAWGGGREESPMDLLRKLAAASGRLSSPIEEVSMMESITQRLQQQNRASSRPRNTSSGAAPPNEMQEAMPPPSSSAAARRSTFSKRQSVAANTSTALSEAGQGRRVAPHQQQNSIAGNIFSDLMGQDMSGNATFFTNRKSDAFTLPGDGISNLEGTRGGDSSTSYAEDNDREEELERRIANESARVERVLDDDEEEEASSVNDETRRLENLSASFAQGDESEVPFDTGYASPPEDDRRDTTASDAAQSVSRESARGVNYDDSGDFDAGMDQIVNDDGATFQEDPMGSAQYEDGQEYSDNSSAEEDDDGQEEEPLDQSKELQAARMALLRKRRAKKKAKRFSSITGNPVPALPSDLIKGLFTSFTTPNAGIGTMQSSKGKIRVEKSASEAVEDLSHHFFAQFSQALVSQAEQSSRTRVTEKDVIALMKSQGQISARHSLSFLARRYLPRELSDLITSTTTTTTTDEASSKTQKRPAARKQSIPLTTIGEGEDTTILADDTTAMEE